jgi:ABC-type nitrate/sulfonate/bicarbonate transport system substrate-binding protein
MKPLPSISVSIEHSRRITFFRFCVSVFAALLACSFASAVRAEERIKIVVGYSSISVSQAVPWVMREAKLFEKYGLNPELVYMASSKVAPAMVSGDLHIAQVGGDMLVRSTLNGFAMVYIGGTNNNFNF